MSDDRKASTTASSRSTATASAAAAAAPVSMSIPALMLAGGLSGFTSRFVTHPLDTIKTQMQVQGAVAVAAGGEVGGVGVGGAFRGGATGAASASASAAGGYRGVLDGAAKIMAREGPLGFYRGFGAVVTGVPFASAAYFGGYESAKILVPESMLGPTATYVVSGMWAQMLAGVRRGKGQGPGWGGWREHGVEEEKETE